MCIDFAVAAVAHALIITKQRRLGLPSISVPDALAGRTTVFAGQFVGTREVADKIWLVSFLDFDLGFFDEAAARVEPGANPFASKVLTMCPV